MENGRPLVEKAEECHMESRHRQGCSPPPPPMSVKGRWVGPVSKYWTYRSHVGDMGPVNLVTGCQQKLVFSPLLHWLLWKRSWVQTRGPVSRHAVDWVGRPSSREQWIYSNLFTTMRKVAMHWPREVRMVWDYMRTKHGMRVACWSGFPCRVYINLIHVDSRIWVTAYLWSSACS
jgi:hypothetical protein